MDELVVELALELATEDKLSLLDELERETGGLLADDLSAVFLTPELPPPQPTMSSKIHAVKNNFFMILLFPFDVLW